jgi:hypothetical protein
MKHLRRLPIAFASFLALAATPGNPTGGALDSHEGEPGPFYIQGDRTGGLKYRNIPISVPKKRRRTSTDLAHSDSHVARKCYSVRI